MVEVFSSMVKSKFRFVQMQVEDAFVEAAEEACFRKAPKPFNPVARNPASSKFTLAKIDMEMLSLSHLNPPIVSSPPIRIHHTRKGHFARNNRLPGRYTTVRHEFRVDLSIPLKERGDDGVAVGPTSPLPLDTARSKVGFIHFDLPTERRVSFRIPKCELVSLPITGSP